jgi:hypothetical protein
MVKNIFRRQSKLDEPIDRVLDDMKVFDPDSPEYEKLLGHLERLKKLRLEESALPSGDTWAIVLGNLAGILTIVAYEQNHVMVSKALGMLLRNRHTN